MTKLKGSETPGRSVEELIALAKGQRVQKAKSAEEAVGVPRVPEQKRLKVTNSVPDTNSSGWAVPALVLSTLAVGGAIILSSKSDGDSGVVIEPISNEVSARIRARLEELDPDKGFPVSEIQGFGFEREEQRKPFNPFTHNVEYRDERIGDEHLFLQPYARVQDIATAAEYYSFLVNTVQNPEDVGDLADHSFLPFSSDVGMIQPPVNYLKMGAADCEGYSILSCQALEVLGKRQGKDYHPRVISQSSISSGLGHAICMYEEGGKQWVIDQSEPYELDSISRPEVISSGFIPAAEATALRQNWVDTDGKIFEVSLDANLQDDKKLLFAFLPKGAEIDPKDPDFSFLPSGWQDYKDVNVCIGYDPVRIDKGGTYNNACGEFIKLADGRIQQIDHRS